MGDLKYPKGEHVWVNYYDLDNNLRFILTSKSSSRDYYYLYELEGDAFKKLGRAESPSVLEETFMVDMKLRGGDSP
jgi:hypothetical protein